MAKVDNIFNHFNITSSILKIFNSWSSFAGQSCWSEGPWFRWCSAPRGRQDCCSRSNYRLAGWPPCPEGMQCMLGWMSAPLKALMWSFTHCKSDDILVLQLQLCRGVALNVKDAHVQRVQLVSLLLHLRVQWLHLWSVILIIAINVILSSLSWWSSWSPSSHHPIVNSRLHLFFKVAQIFSFLWCDHLPTILHVNLIQLKQ